ncbi:TIGR03557 family F420-dependent LLM class oxidoreductase [Solirubrobacter taibaiensis]|nr:TIGR03557 family F420-dependent LLM class oxidoreductase [Solirubrobacter taibaiensis]
MTRYFLGISQEQFPPEALLEQAVAAEKAGFDGLSSSDHLQPWWEPGESGHTWPWLGAAGMATSKLPLGTGVTPTGARYHPALIAQAWVTLERLFPGRPFLGIGSGEALNEVPIGDDWPSVGDQIARMDEALSIIDRLWKGETITEEGRFYTCRDLKLHTLSDRRVPIWISAFGPQAAAVAAKWGDGIWTLPDPESTPGLLDAWRDAGGSGEVVFQALFSWARDDEAAMDAARKWKGAQPQEHYKDDWHEPRKMYAHGEEQMSDSELAEKAIIGSDPALHAERIRELEELGPTVIVLQNNSGADPLKAIEVYGRDVLPALRG